ncbi:MAG: spermine synthase [Pseudomonadota bacterium]
MQRYDGTLIHRTRDEGGDIEVVEDAVYRSLHFGSAPKQSSMLRRDPLYLALAYTRAMSAALLFHRAPQRILLIGLGGGSLAKFLLHHLPDCRIDAVESRAAVIEVAHSHFALPEELRLSLRVGDGGHFVRQAAGEARGGYDMIFVDAFLGGGIARSVCGISFLEASRLLLSEEGVFSMNLWNGDFITAREMLEDIRQSFDGNVLQLAVEGKDNTIALALNGGNIRKRLKRLGDRAERLGELTGVEYTAFAKQLRKQNSWLPF